MVVAIPSYETLHARLRRRRGRASEHSCVECDAPATQWAYDRSDPNEITGRHHGGWAVTYSIDLDRYQPLCSTCHNRRDHPRQDECLRGHEMSAENTYERGGRRHCRACKALLKRVRRARRLQGAGHE